MATENRKTPGVYVEEQAAFPPSVVGVDTAIPAFIGYTERAELNGKSLKNVPTRIGSMVEFEQLFGGRFGREFRIVDLEALPNDNSAMTIDNPGFPAGSRDPSAVVPGDSAPCYFAIEPVNAGYYLHDSVEMFYENGGATCYIVSADVYNAQAKVERDRLEAALAAVKDQVGPTMLVMPDAVNLPKIEEFGALARSMLAQAGDLEDRIAVLDVWGTPGTTAATLDAVIGRFRNEVGSDNLSYGAAYFPFVTTTVLDVKDINHTNIAAESQPRLLQLLTYQNYNLNYDPNATDGGSMYGGVQNLIEAVAATGWATPPTPANEAAIVALQNNLSAALPLMSDLANNMTKAASTLPPSGPMAGVIAQVDASQGAWNPPANVSIRFADALSFGVTDAEQGDLNLPIDGKAVNAIREFPGRGIIVWGARTLDGNSGDYRYISVRRTLIYVEQSIKPALEQFVFAANDGQTWTTVVAMCSNFLQGLWSQGGLMGSTAAQAFTVECGIGSTMTQQDIHNGDMIVQVTLQMIHPAEYIVLTFRQKMGA